MAKQRHFLAGWTDYTGVGLKDICDHLREWHAYTQDAISALEKCGVEVDKNAHLLQNPREIRRYIAFFLDLFWRYLGDLERLLRELPSGVRQRHVEMVMQIYRSSELEQDHCIKFKNDFIEKSLPDEEVRLLLDEIYKESRQQLIDFADFSNLAPRLRTYLEEAGDWIEQEPILELRPNLWGLGVNLRPIWQRLRSWWRKRDAA